MTKMNYFLLFSILISTTHCATLIALSSSCLADFRYGILSAHNNYRALHSTPALVANATIDSIALSYANYLATNDLFQHSNQKDLGENLAGSWYTYAPNLANCTTFGISFAKMWYNEISSYNFNMPGYSSATGHFTQLVWKSSTQLGCGFAVSTSNKLYGVCNYSPQGNIVNAGYFQNNVLPLKSG